MITVEVQIHGYRMGHQLLASSIILPKADQAVVDRLSDVAGPLRPKEQFSPYLSAYPLPSGTHYVIARTWQDLTVPRAGCVLTKSVLLDADTWSRNPPLVSILHLLRESELPTETNAVRIELDELLEERLPPAPNFNASELLEALFLEDLKPVVVFDAPDPEQIAMRLLIALWPDMRRQFSLSTFALSPRKIQGRDLDLIFAPSNAKAKFSDWPGRRVDGSTVQTDRHRWTSTIAQRVFDEPLPRLLSNREINLLGDRDADNAAALRIVLLWDELLGKLDRIPTAALGLLDIANSGLVNNAEALRLLEPRLTEATHRAADNLSHSDAWDFISAITQKMHRHVMSASWMAVEQLVAHLAERAPEGAINLLLQPDSNGSISKLLPSVAIGLSNGTSPRVEQLLAVAPPDIIVHLVSQSGALASRVAQDDALINRMGSILTQVGRELADKAAMMLLPFLTEDRQLSAAIPIFDRLDSRGVAAELGILRDANAFHSKLLCTALIDRSREVGGLSAVRDVLISSDASAQRDALLEQTVDPIATDVLWLLDEGRLSKKLSNKLLMAVLRRADDRKFAKLLDDQTIGERIVARLPGEAVDILARAALLDSLPINTYISVIQSVIPTVDDARKLEIAQRATKRCLCNRFGGDEAAVLSLLLGILGAQLDGTWVVRTGLERSRDAAIASRNLIVFEMAPTAARLQIVGVVDEIARVLQDRHGIDLTETAYDACARLMFDAEKKSRTTLVKAADWLMPSLIRARRQPVSLMIAALFPMIYRELAKTDDEPNLLKFLPFFYDWNPCKTARRELVDAFLASSWNPGDLALTACRCGHVTKILKRVAISPGGEKYLTQIENNLDRLVTKDQDTVKRAIIKIQSDKSHKLDW